MMELYQKAIAEKFNNIFASSDGVDESLLLSSLSCKYTNVIRE